MYKGLLIFVIPAMLWGQVFAQSARQDTLRELVRKVDILTRELEKQRLGEVAEREYQSKFGLGPAASQVYYRKDSGVSLAGYGEMIFQNFSATADDGSASGAKDQLDYLRGILYFGYKFNERFLFNTEIEIEHAKVGEGAPGEVAIEFGYIDALLSPAVNLRGGMVLIPLGIINELHEPTTFYGVLRPETERRIIPSTWRAVGAGMLGSLPAGLAYRVYVTEGLNAANFSAAGIRSGRQNGAQALAEDLAVTGRLEYNGIPGLIVGGSVYAGNSGQGLADSSGRRIDALTTLFSAQGIFARRGLEIRALYAFSAINDAAELNRALGFSGQQSIGERQLGYYAAVAYDVLQWIRPGSEAQLQPFIQYEQLNTQDKAPAGFATDPAREQTNFTLGLMFKPIPQLAIKLDYINRDNKAGSAVDQLNAGIGYLF